MAKENPLMMMAKERGIVDNREIGTVADVIASNGNRGRAVAFVNGDKLYLFEFRFPSSIGDLVEMIDLSKSKVLKARSFALATLLVLEYNGVKYKFEHFGLAKQLIEAVQAACEE